MAQLARTQLGLACFIAGGCLSAPTYAESMGVIRVESTTIDDRFETKRAEASSVAAISGETVDGAHVENIQQLLQGVSGITTEVQSGDSLKIHIRGVENQVFMGEKPGVAIVIDGVPVFERTGRVNIDLDNIESIRVIKGGASYLFGDDALSGAVIITTKRGAKMAGVKLAGEAGSYGYQKGLARVGFAAEDANGHVQISRREGDGFHDDSAYRADYANGKLQYYLSDVSDLTFGFETSERMKNSHGSVRGVTAADQDPTSLDPAYNDYSNRYQVELDKYFLTWSWDTGDHSNLMVNTYSFADHTRFFSSPVRETTDYNYFNDYQQAQRGIKTEYRSGGEAVAWMLAADLRDNDYENRVTVVDNTRLWGFPAPVVGSLSDDNLTNERVRAAYGELKFRVLAPWTVTLNGRHDVIDLDYRDRLDTTRSGGQRFEVDSWRLGNNLALTENTDVYANVSTGFRAPTVDQLFVGNSTPTSRVDANPALRPEHSLNTELGLRSRRLWGGVRHDLDMSVFQLDRTDHIQASAGQYTTGVDNQYDNVGDIRHRGFELSLRSDPARRWSWDLAYTRLDAFYTHYDSFYLRSCDVGTADRCSVWSSEVFDNAGNTVPRVPEHRVNLAVTHRPAQHWSVTLGVDATSAYYADEVNRIEIDGHETWHLLANYDRPRWSLYARVDNLFDTAYYNTARGHYDANYDGVYDDEDLSIVVNAGRTWTAGLSMDF